MYCFFLDLYAYTPVDGFLQEYADRIDKIYKEKKLVSLLDYMFRSDLTMERHNILKFVQVQTGHVRDQLKKQGNHSWDSVVDDMCNAIPRSIKFALANLYLHWDPALDRYIADDKPTPLPINTNMFFYMNATFEELYKFWDRVGDLLWLSFGQFGAGVMNRAERDVNFDLVIQDLGKTKYAASEHFHFLEQFRKGDYRAFLKSHRKDIVHYKKLETKLLFDYIDNHNDPARLSILRDEKERLPSLLKKQFNLTVPGFQHAISLIGEIP